MTKQIVEDIKYLLEAEDANREVSAEEKKEKRKKFLKRLAMIGIPVAALATAGAVAYKKGVGPFKKSGADKAKELANDIGDAAKNVLNSDTAKKGAEALKDLGNSAQDSIKKLMDSDAAKNATDKLKNLFN